MAYPLATIVALFVSGDPFAGIVVGGTAGLLAAMLVAALVGAALHALSASSRPAIQLRSLEALPHIVVTRPLVHSRPRRRAARQLGGPSHEHSADRRLHTGSVA